VSVLVDTCVEIYTVDGDQYTKVKDAYLPNEFDVYTYQAAMGTDPTGMFINGTFPFNVYSGHACAQVPQGRPFCDHMLEQMLPVSDLGKEHYVPGIFGRDNRAGYV